MNIVVLSRSYPGHIKEVMQVVDVIRMVNMVLYKRLFFNCAVKTQVQDNNYYTYIYINRTNRTNRTKLMISRVAAVLSRKFDMTI